MSVSVRIPANMRSATDGVACIEIEGSCVAEVLQGMAERFPDLQPRLLDSSGELLSYVSLYLGETNVMDLEGMQTELGDGSEILIVSALAGG